MPYPQLPPGMTSGVEDEQKMRKLVAEVLLDALFSPEQLELVPFEAELAADIQQEEDEDESSQQSSSVSSSQQASSSSSFQQQPATAKTPSRKLSASTSNIVLTFHLLNKIKFFTFKEKAQAQSTIATVHRPATLHFHSESTIHVRCAVNTIIRFGPMHAVFRILINVISVSNNVRTLPDCLRGPVSSNFLLFKL
jgi:hypothetical protein